MRSNGAISNLGPASACVARGALHGVSLVYVVAVLLGAAAQLVDPAFAAALSGATTCGVLEGDPRGPTGVVGHRAGSQIPGARAWLWRGEARAAGGLGKVGGRGLAGPGLLLDCERSLPPPELG